MRYLAIIVVLAILLIVTTRSSGNSPDLPPLPKRVERPYKPPTPLPVQPFAAAPVQPSATVVAEAYVVELKQTISMMGKESDVQGPVLQALARKMAPTTLLISNGRTLPALGKVLGRITLKFNVEWDAYGRDQRIVFDNEDAMMSTHKLPRVLTLSIDCKPVEGASSWDGMRTISAETSNPETVETGPTLFRQSSLSLTALSNVLAKKVDEMPAFTRK